MVKKVQKFYLSSVAKYLRFHQQVSPQGEIKIGRFDGRASREVENVHIMCTGQHLPRNRMCSHPVSLRTV